MIHTIDKKIIEDRIAFFEELKANLVVNNKSKWNAILNELQSILSKIEELEVVDGDEVVDNYIFNPQSDKSFSDYLTDNNYIIVKIK